MRILVGINVVYDWQMAPKVAGQGVSLDHGAARSVTEPFAEIALEAAIRLKESGKADEVIVISVGAENVVERLKYCLAMGADRAIHVTHGETVEVGPRIVAQTLAAVGTSEGVSLIMVGKQSVDSDLGQVGPMVAGILGWPQGTFVSALDLSSDEVVVTREIDEGREVLALKLPAVITADLRLNEPRFASFADTMKAKKKPLAVINLESLSVQSHSERRVVKYSEMPERPAVIMLSSIAEFKEVIKNG